MERERELEYHDIHLVEESINELIAAVEQAQAENKKLLTILLEHGVSIR